MMGDIVHFTLLRLSKLVSSASGFTTLYHYSAAGLSSNYFILQGAFDLYIICCHPSQPGMVKALESRHDCHSDLPEEHVFFGRPHLKSEKNAALCMTFERA